MERREPPPTEEGWYALHDFRTVDWDAWREASGRARERALADGRSYLESVEAVENAAEGASVTYSVLGHKADLLVLHLRPTLAEVNALERRFEGTDLAGFTDRSTSYVSVTEVSGYSDAAQPYFEGGKVDDQGLANYIDMRLHPTVPDASYICFYPMSKRREGAHNWYDLPFDERAAHMSNHGDIGRRYGGEVTQMITGSIGLDDWEWGVTLWANDPTRFKRLLYEMRFDPSTSLFAEFGPFLVGERLRPEQLEDFLAGEVIDDADDARGDQAPVEDADQSGHPTDGAHGGAVRDELEELGVYAGQPHGEDVHALVLFSEADASALSDEVSGLRGNFDHYDTHVKTAVYRERGGDRTAVASIWETERAADIASGYLSDLPGIIGRAGGAADGFGTMGLFYTVEPDHRQEFVTAFDDITELLSEMDGHLETSLFENVDDENDTFISSRWESKDDAMAFFRSEDFRDTVDWGREILADRPRHVFLA